MAATPVRPPLTRTGVDVLGAVRAAGADGGGAGEAAAHGDRCRRVGGGAVAELAEAVATPAFDGAVRELCARVRAAGADGGDAGEAAAHEDRCRRVGGG